MCSLSILAHNENGYIISCNDCGNFQLAFGTLAVKLQPKMYNHFSNQINALFECNSCSGFCNQKRFHVDIYSDISIMVLNFVELKNLKELIELANFNTELASILEENNMV